MMVAETPEVSRVRSTQKYSDGILILLLRDWAYLESEAGIELFYRTVFQDPEISVRIQLARKLGYIVPLGRLPIIIANSSHNFRVPLFHFIF